MAKYQSHVSFSILLGIVYALLGVVFFHVYPEHALLAAVIILVAGMLPDIDATNGAPARELGGLLAAIAPLLFIEYFPGIKAGGVARVALVVICGYLLTRIVFIRILQIFTKRRGVLHSIPASIVVFELVYLLFWDLYWQDRLYLAFAAFVGFFSHLLLDASSNVDLLGKAMGNRSKEPAVLKLGGYSTAGTFLLYACMIFLGYFVVLDFYPNIRIH